jgi:hypothetical protein
MSNLRERKISADASCAKARERVTAKMSKPGRSPANVLMLFEDPSECVRAKEIERQWKEAQQRWDDFEESARKSEVPWQWIE